MTITEFLEARIADDEATAEAASVSMHGDRHKEAWDYASYVLSSERDATEAQDKFVTEWWPARVLAECAAKRSIIAIFKDRCPEVFDGERWVSPLASLAAVYADHPGYRQEWAK